MGLYGGYKKTFKKKETPFSRDSFSGVKGAKKFKPVGTLKCDDSFRRYGTIVNCNSFDFSGTLRLHDSF